MRLTAALLVLFTSIVSALPDEGAHPLSDIFLGLRTTDQACQEMFPGHRVESQFTEQDGERTLSWKCRDLNSARTLPAGEVLYRGRFEGTCEDDEFADVSLEYSDVDSYEGVRPEVNKGRCLSNEGDEIYRSISAGQTECVQGETSSRDREQVISAWTTDAYGTKKSVRSAITSIFSSRKHRQTSVSQANGDSISLTADGGKTLYRACARALPGLGNIILHAAVYSV